jgi:hypothetical protein
MTGSSQYASAMAVPHSERTLSMATLFAFGWSLPFGGMLKVRFGPGKNSGNAQGTHTGVETVGGAGGGCLRTGGLGYVEAAQSENDAADFGGERE